AREARVATPQRDLRHARRDPAHGRADQAYRRETLVAAGKLMTETIHRLIEQYGLVAVFLGCVAEGESAAILGGFFAHQQVFVLWQAFVAAFLGAFAGDTFFFILGRSFADHRYVRSLRRRPGFRRAYRLLNTHPNIFVLTNRYVYGMRLVGGVAAGLSTVS